MEDTDQLLLSLRLEDLHVNKANGIKQPAYSNVYNHGNQMSSDIYNTQHIIMCLSRFRACFFVYVCKLSSRCSLPGFCSHSCITAHISLHELNVHARHCLVRSLSENFKENTIMEEEQLHTWKKPDHSPQPNTAAQQT